LLRRAALLLWAVTGAAHGYSVLTHEELIDLTWKNLLAPAIQKRFPQTTAVDLDKAHAYAYGGCAIQDLGYYPFSNELFSDLTHYVRRGDFVANLLRNARNANEFAFALGALSHYVGDTVGHHDAINRATAIAFPKLERKYGSRVAYGQSPHAHIRTEFAFDIDQLSKHRLAPGAYLRAVGFRVPSRVLAQAFEETYSLPLARVVGRHRPAMRSYRSSVRSFLPRFSYAETVIHKNDFPPEMEDDALRTFLGHVERADFQTEWNRYRRKAGIETRLLALLIRILPKVGVLSDLAIKIPTPDTQDLYVKSVNRAIDVYGDFVGQSDYSIPNCDLDTGEKSRPGIYGLTDKTYAALLHRIVRQPGRPIAPDLKQEILAYYSEGSAHMTDEIRKDLAALREAGRMRPAQTEGLPH
jgi:hypothetical protein